MNRKLSVSLFMHQVVDLKGHVISLVTSVKFLGLLIDEHLICARHIEYLVKDLSNLFSYNGKLKSAHSEVYLPNI